MALDLRGLSRRIGARAIAPLARFSRFLLAASDPNLEPALRDGLRTAQLEAVGRHSMLMLVGNLCNAAVIVAVAARSANCGICAGLGRPASGVPEPGPFADGPRSRRPERPRAVSQRTLTRFIRNAGILGAFWGLAPFLFINTGGRRRSSWSE